MRSGRTQGSYAAARAVRVRKDTVDRPCKRCKTTIPAGTELARSDYPEDGAWHLPCWEAHKAEAKAGRGAA